MQQWWQFYTVVAGVAATLTGLLFVAVSFNAAQLVAGEPGGPRSLAEQAFRSYVATILLSLVSLIPTLSLQEFGLSALAITGSAAVLSVYHLQAFLGRRPPGRKTLLPPMSRRLLSAVVGFGLLVYAEVSIAFFNLNSRDTLAAGVVVLLASAVVTSWDLLVRLGTQEGSGGK